MHAVDCCILVYTKINFPEPMPHENKFPGRAHAENKLSVQTKCDSPPPPPLRIKWSSPYIAFKRPHSITDKLSVAHCALRVAPFTTSQRFYCSVICSVDAMFIVNKLMYRYNGTCISLHYI